MPWLKKGRANGSVDQLNAAAGLVGLCVSENELRLSLVNAYPSLSCLRKP